MVKKNDKKLDLAEKIIVAIIGLIGVLLLIFVGPVEDQKAKMTAEAKRTQGVIQTGAPEPTLTPTPALTPTPTPTMTSTLTPAPNDCGSEILEVIEQANNSQIDFMKGLIDEESLDAVWKDDARNDVTRLANSLKTKGDMYFKVLNIKKLIMKLYVLLRKNTQISTSQ